MKLKIKRKGKTYFLKICRGGCGTWYHLPAERRCQVCGSGMVKVNN